MSSKNYIILLLFFLLVEQVCSQKRASVPAEIKNLFEDLQIDDPAKNSALKANEDPSRKISQNIFVVASISKTKAWLEEPVLLTYHLYTSLQSTSKVSKLPSLFGADLFPIGTNNERPSLKKFHGKLCRLFVVQQYQLTGFQEGAIKISPLSIENTVHYLDREGNKHEYTGTVTSNELEILISPLPTKNKPANFSGAVGQFQVACSVAVNSIAAGENNNLHIEISGTGNFSNIGLPEIDWPTESEHFLVKQKDSVQTNLFPSTGKKIFDIPFIVKKEGDFFISPLHFTFFDASKRQYRFLESAPILLHISNVLYADKASPKPITDRSTIPYHNAFLAVLGTLLAALALYLIFLGKRKKNMPLINDPSTESPALEATPTDFIKEVDKIGQLASGETTISAYKKLLSHYVQEKFLIADGPDWLTLLEQRNSALSKRAKSFLDSCDHLLYANYSLSPDTIAQLKNDFLSIMAMEDSSEEIKK